MACRRYRCCSKDIAELVVEDVQVSKTTFDVDAAGVQKTEILDRRCLRAWVGEVGLLFTRILCRAHP